MLATSWFMWLNGGNAPAHFKLPSPQATNPALVVNALWQLPMSALLLVQRKELEQMEKYEILHLPSLSCFPLIFVQLSGATFQSNFQEKLSRATFKSNFLEQLSRATFQSNIQEKLSRATFQSNFLEHYLFFTNVRKVDKQLYTMYRVHCFPPDS